jgi:hypothetical protein
MLQSSARCCLRLSHILLRSSSVSPCCFALQRKGIRGLGVYPVLGATIGAAAVCLFFGMGPLFSGRSAVAHAIAFLRRPGLVAAFYAAIASAVFWVIAVD